MDKIKTIKDLVKKEIKNSKNVDLRKIDFLRTHLLGVEKWAKFLLRRLPKADKEIVILGVWLHDLQRIRSIKGDHQKIGAQEAEKMMRNFNYDEPKIKKVKEIILTHSCNSSMPKSLEGKILATADAMSHYFNDFYLSIAITGKRNLEEYKKWVIEKLKRNYNKKIFFSFAKREIKDRHNLFLKIFTMK